MKTDWKAEVSRIVFWKQKIAERDKDNALPWVYPRVAASETEILLAENKIGVKFPRDYVELLMHVNGWKGFYVLNDLFGTEELINGFEKEVMDRDYVKNFISNNDLIDSGAFAICASMSDIDVFLCFPENSKFLPGGVLWLAHEEVDRFRSVGEYFSSMVNYNALILNEFPSN